MADGSHLIAARHPLHALERAWPETNCYADLWIEVLSHLGHEPRAAFGFTVTQDWEGDHFTFFKPPLEDLSRSTACASTKWRSTTTCRPT